MNTLDLLGFDPEYLNLTQAIEAETFELSVIENKSYLDNLDDEDVAIVLQAELDAECDGDYEDDDFTDEEFDACMAMECSNDWFDR